MASSRSKAPAKMTPFLRSMLESLDLFIETYPEGDVSEAMARQIAKEGHSATVIAALERVVKRAEEMIDLLR